MGIGSLIKHHRKLKGITQKELADIIGCAEVTIRQYEADRREPSYDICKKIEKALDFQIFMTKKDEYTKIVKDSYRILEELGKDGNEEISYLNNKVSIRIGKTEDQLIREEVLLQSFNKLNDNGQDEAVKRVEELTEIPRYQEGYQEEDE